MVEISRRRTLALLCLAGGGMVSGCADESTSVTPTTAAGETATPVSSSVPMFRYDAANTGHHLEGTGPTADDTVRWRIETDGIVRSSPAVVDGTVYVGSGDGGLYAIEAATGDLRWQTSLGGSVWSSPAVVGETVYAGSTSGAVYALATADGEERWQIEAGGSITGSPTVVSETVYLGADDGTLLALDTASGAERWRRPLTTTTERSDRRPSPSDRRLAYEPSGRRLQVGSQGAGPAVSTPAVVDGTVYVATGTGLFALDSASGDRRWSIAFEESAGAGADDSTRLVADGATGSVDRLQATIDLPSSPAVHSGTVYVGRYPESVAVDTDAGRVRWRAGQSSGTVAAMEPPVARLQLTSAIDSSPAVTSENVYLGGDGVTALERQSGAVNWTRSLSGTVHSSPAVGGGTVYVGTTDGRVVGLDAGSGDTAWSAETDGSVVSSPAVTNGALYVGSLDGAVYAFE